MTQRDSQQVDTKPRESFKLWAVVDGKDRIRIDELGNLCVYIPKHVAVREARHAGHVSNKQYFARKAVLTLVNESKEVAK